MLFNSYEFACLLLFVLPLYLLLRRKAPQNVLLLAASYVFYGWWDYRFLSLLLLSTVTDYYVALALDRVAERRPRRLLLLVSCTVNLGLLGFFKYGNLFASTANGIGNALGIEGLLIPELRILLPVGISFYTFQTLSYTIEVYRGHHVACRSFLDFALYVSFFPQLVAGPIERPQRLLTAMQQPRPFELRQLEEAAFLFGSGWFRKSLGDVMGTLSDPGFADPTGSSAWALLWGLYAFAFQIYLDFSGYTDMARGVAKALGFDLMVNFRAPYFARSVRDFWQRWHISLSTWLRDYLYIPLGGNRGPGWAVQRNLMATMLLGGLWHGASWNFAVWGLLHGLYLAAHRALVHRTMGAPPRARSTRRTAASLISRIASGIVTFHLVLVAWVFFRAGPVDGASAISVAFSYLARLAGLAGEAYQAPPREFSLLGLILIIDLLLETSRDAYWVRGWFWPARALCIAVLLSLGFVLGSGESRAFIYFQF